MGELGLTAAPFPEAVGGAGFSYLGWTLVMEELGAADMSMAVSLSVHILSQYPVVTWGTDEQRARWLPAMLAGEALGAFALTEPHAGSDAAAIRTRAERVGPADAPTAYRLTGTKIWISNAPEAERYLVFATLDPTAGPKAITAFLVEKGTAGFRFGAHEKKMGIRACPATELVFEGCRGAGREPARRAEGEGYRIALSALGGGPDLDRAGVRRDRAGRAGGGGALSPAATGVRRAAGRAAGAPVHARRDGPRGGRRAGRDAGGGRAPRTVANRSPRSRRSRSGPPRTPRCGWRPTPSSCSAPAATRARPGVERLMRDAKGAQIYEGTNQIHRLIVADEVLRGLGVDSGA